MKTNLFMVIGILFWGMLTGLVLHSCGFFVSFDLLGNITSSVFVCALYTLAVVRIFSLQAKEPYRAFFFPIPALLILLFWGIITRF